MKDHSAEEIVDKLASDFVTGDKATDVKAVENAKAILSLEGTFKTEDPRTPLAVLKTFNASVEKTDIDLSKTWTNAFVEKVLTQVSN